VGYETGSGLEWTPMQIQGLEQTCHWAQGTPDSWVSGEEGTQEFLSLEQTEEDDSLEKTGQDDSLEETGEFLSMGQTG